MTTASPPPYSLSPSLATPADYVKYHPSVPLPLPTVRHVGLLACQLDPLLRTLETRILSASPAPPPPAAAPAKGGKARPKATDKPELASPPPAAGRVFELELEDTVLFPEGGGQNSDTGTVVVGAHTLQVLHVLRQGLRAVHFVVVPADAEGELEAGKAVALHIDWDRRMDLMTHHTGQHLVSALLDSLPEPAATLSWSLTPTPTPCYIEISRNLTPAEIAAVEDRANALVQQATRVTVEVEDQEEGKGLSEGEREKVRQSRKGIPEDYEKGVVRTIVIEGVEANPCCGTHIPNLSLLSAVHLLPQTTPHTSTTRRLYFVTSGRLATFTRASSTVLAAVSAALGGAPSAMLPERIAALSDGSKAADKNVKALKTELAELVGAGLKTALDSATTKGLVYQHRDAASDASAGTDFLGAVSLAAIPTPAAETEPGRLLVLSASGAGGHSVHLSGTPSLVAAFGERIKQAAVFAGRIKGGGAKGKWQAKLSGGAFGMAEQAWVETALDEMRTGL